MVEFQGGKSSWNERLVEKEKHFLGDCVSGKSYHEEILGMGVWERHPRPLTPCPRSGSGGV